MDKIIWIVPIIFVIMLAAPVEVKDDAYAVRAADGAGLRNVRVLEKHGIAPRLHGCAEDDSVAFDVSGTNATGSRVTAIVCCGLVWKGCTVRF